MIAMINLVDCLIDGSIFFLGVGFGYCVGWLNSFTQNARADDVLNHLVRRNRR